MNKEKYQLQRKRVFYLHMGITKHPVNIRNKKQNYADRTDMNQ